MEPVTTYPLVPASLLRESSTDSVQLQLASNASPDRAGSSRLLGAGIGKKRAPERATSTFQSPAIDW